MKIIHFLHPRYHPKIIGHILKKNKKRCVCIREIVRLIIMKMKRMQKKDHINTTQVDLDLDMVTI